MPQGQIEIPTRNQPNQSFGLIHHRQSRMAIAPQQLLRFSQSQIGGNAVNRSGHQIPSRWLVQSGLAQREIHCKLRATSWATSSVKSEAKSGRIQAATSGFQRVSLSDSLLAWEIGFSSLGSCSTNAVTLYWESEQCLLCFSLRWLLW